MENELWLLERNLSTPLDLFVLTHIFALWKTGENISSIVQDSARGRAENNAESNKKVYIRRTENAGEPHC